MPSKVTTAKSSAKRRSTATAVHSGRKSVRVSEAVVPKNSSGGVRITADEINTAFQFFDKDGSGKITPKMMKDRMNALNRNVNKKEVLGMFNGRAGGALSQKDLKDLLLDNEVVDFDPVAEAFQALDPTGSGYAETELLRKIFQNLGFGGEFTCRCCYQFLVCL